MRAVLFIAYLPCRARGLSQSPRWPSGWGRWTSPASWAPAARTHNQSAAAVTSRSTGLHTAVSQHWAWLRLTHFRLKPGTISPHSNSVKTLPVLGLAAIFLYAHSAYEWRQENDDVTDITQAAHATTHKLSCPGLHIRWTLYKTNSNNNCFESVLRNKRVKSSTDSVVI